MLNEDLQVVIDKFISVLVEDVIEFKELRDATIELHSNETSLTLYEEINQRKQTISLLKAQGLPISDDQENSLAELMRRMRDDQTIMNYLRLKNLARKKAIEIGNLLENNIGVDFSSGKVCK